ncbi:hypothetical protein HDU84_001051 [Entophlyctis sp. JEL0112]|nr:hypothetical protein HDU84_001051 [Entophlyctis sp. JEL0112]
MSIRLRLLAELDAETYDCSVCMNSIVRDEPIYACFTCFVIFHLRCIAEWADSSGFALSTDDPNYDPYEWRWRCPGCQTLQYYYPETVCFCRAALDERDCEKARRHCSITSMKAAELSVTAWIAVRTHASSCVIQGLAIRAEYLLNRVIYPISHAVPVVVNLLTVWCILARQLVMMAHASLVTLKLSKNVGVTKARGMSPANTFLRHLYARNFVESSLHAVLIPAMKFAIRIALGLTSLARCLPTSFSDAHVVAVN